MWARRPDDTDDAAVAVITDDDLALIAFEVQEPGPGAEGQRGVRVVEWVWKHPITARIRAPPVDCESPCARIQVVGGARRGGGRGRGGGPGRRGGARGGG